MIYWSDVANALLPLQIRTTHIANILNQHWRDTGNIFPYFSPAAWKRGQSTEHRILSPARLPCAWHWEQVGVT
jgi:hypothetical protein